MLIKQFSSLKFVQNRNNLSQNKVSLQGAAIYGAD